MKSSAKKHIDSLVARYPKLESAAQSMEKSVEILIETYKRGGKVLVCGNGGSAADSEHIVGELMKGFVLERKLPESFRESLAAAGDDGYIYENLQGALPAVSLVGQLSLSTAFANDRAPDLCFAQSVLGLGKPGDTLIVISTSGNSKNCVYAAKTAKALNMNVISFTGSREALLDEISDAVIKAPETETYKIQEYHLPIYHTVCLCLEEEFFSKF